MAEKFFPGVNSIGRRFSLGSPFNEKESMTIVGVAADARYYSLRDPIPAMEFCAAFQVPDQDSHNSAYAGDVEVRVNGNPKAMPSQIRAALAEVSGSLPVTTVTLLKEEVSDSLRLNRSAAELSSAFGSLALFLSCIGVYGTMAYRVSRRTHEIGVRLALGAHRSDVLWLITKECLLLVAAGLVIGVPVALASAAVIASQLFGIGPTDPLTFAAVVVLLVLAALMACYVPARRATRVDPVVALRYE
jgi:ABC-type antimicrobial peptide transport system permease subunit